MNVEFVLESGIALARLRLRMFALDLLWKCLYLISIFILVSAGAAFFLHDLQSYRWQGPELASSNPILAAMAAAELWKQFSPELAWIGLVTMLASAGLFITYEAVFRGGVRQFWVYAASRMISLAVIASVAIFLSALAVRDRNAQTMFLVAAIWAAVWFIANAGETLVRRRALDLLATDLRVVSGVMGILLGLHLLLTIAAAAIAWFGISVIQHAENPLRFLGAVLLMAVAFIFSAVVHSYLLVVRYSAIDIMRNNVVEV